MSGKKGQQGTKATEVPTRYSEGFLDDMDGRGRVAKSLRERSRALISDLGGATTLSYQELSLVRRIVHLERLIEKKEANLARGIAIDENIYFTSLNALSSLLAKIGMKRRARQVQLSDYLANKQPGQDQDNRPSQ